MKVSIDEHSGFCFGVTRAIQAAESELEKGSLYCLGDIVHNGQEVARLEMKGLATIDYDDLRTLPAHSRVLLRAHGEPPSTYWIAQQRGIEIIDATCPVVKKLQDRIRACYEQHKNDEAIPPQIVIYGKSGHAEVIGLQGQTNDTAIVIENAEQLDKLDFNRPIYLFSQTTKSVEGFQELVEAIKSKINLCSVSAAVFRIPRHHLPERGEPCEGVAGVRQSERYRAVCRRHEKQQCEGTI